MHVICIFVTVAVVIAVIIVGVLVVQSSVLQRFRELVTFNGCRCMSGGTPDECAPLMELSPSWQTPPMTHLDQFAVLARWEIGTYLKKPSLYTTLPVGESIEVASIPLPAGANLPLALCYSVPSANHLVICCRGTMSASDWAKNFAYEQVPPFPAHSSRAKVHRGFYEQFLTLQAEFEKLLRVERLAHLTVIGHSMGCGVAALCAAHTLVSHPNITVSGLLIASPRVGNPEFSVMVRPARLFTIVNISDPFPALPPVVMPRGIFNSQPAFRYTHVGEIVAFNEFAPSVLNTHGLFPYWRKLKHFR